MSFDLFFHGYQWIKTQQKSFTIFFKIDSLNLILLSWRDKLRKLFMVFSVIISLFIWVFLAAFLSVIFNSDIFGFLLSGAILFFVNIKIFKILKEKGTNNYSSKVSSNINKLKERT